MAEGSHEWRTSEIKDLCETIVSLKTADEAERFLRDLCTISELEAMAHRWHAARLVDLFRGLPGVQVVRDPSGERVVMSGARGGRWSDDLRTAPAADSAVAALNVPRADRTRTSGVAQPADESSCAVQLYVDGVFTPTEHGRIADEVQPGDVEAVEVYRAATEVPAEYRRQGSGCGVILVWTQRYARTR